MGAPWQRPAGLEVTVAAAAWLAGVVALLALGGRRRIARNPFPARSPEAAAWLEGLRAKAAQLARVHGAGAAGLVPCETPDETESKAPGRGRAKCGPRREWLDWEKRLAWICQAALSRREIAALLPGRDAQAVKNQLHRMKRLRSNGPEARSEGPKAGRTGIRDQVSERKAS